MTLEFSRQIFEKYPNIKFLKNKIRPVVAQFHADGRTDRHDEAKSRSSQLCVSA